MGNYGIHTAITGVQLIICDFIVASVWQMTKIILGLLVSDN